MHTIHTDDIYKWAQSYTGPLFHAVLCDPPYHLSAPGAFGPGQFEGRKAAAGFMGKKWDGGDVAFRPETWAAIGDCLLPGAMLLAFGGTRTWHRLACAIEDAGFEIRDTIMWVYGSGFPKSHDVSKAIDKKLPRMGMFDKFAKHFEQQRKKSGKSQKELAGLFPSKTGGITGCVWNWENGANVPTMEQWQILQPLLDLS